MGEAKRKRDTGIRTVYHHTSTLRTHLIWMSGVIEVEGKSPPVLHPQLGTIHMDVLARRAMRDFPPVAWFTTQISVPRCLLTANVFGVDKSSGEKIEIRLDADVKNALALNRIAIGFPISNIPVIPWPKHKGYATSEGRELNATAIEAGDNPEDWYVADGPVEVLQSTEVWSSPSMLKPKLKRLDWYLKDVHRLVRTCRERQDAYIPPTWLRPEEAKALAKSLGLPVGELSD
jgi:hypothetical protein